MNSLLEHELPGNLDLRDQMFEALSDSDLAYRLPGNNLSLGELCEEMGRIQHIYTRSFTTFTQEWGLSGTKPGTAGSVASLGAWFKRLDAELIEALGALSEDDIHARLIDRGDGFMVPVAVHFQIFREALLIFYAKASIYLRALEKPFTHQWRVWIG